MKIILTFLILFFSFSIKAEEIQTILSSKKLLGNGKMTWLTFEAYSAKLYVNDRFSFDKEFVLELKYNMNFKGVDIAKRSIDEMKFVSTFSEYQQDEWLRQMIEIFPSVKKNDRISGVYKPEGKAVFYFNDKLIGEINDKEFARNFFSIWLDEKTSEPKLREKLLALK